MYQTYEEEGLVKEYSQFFIEGIWYLYQACEEEMLFAEYSQLVIERIADIRNRLTKKQCLSRNTGN